MANVPTATNGVPRGPHSNEWAPRTSPHIQTERGCRYCSAGVVASKQGPTVRTDPGSQSRRFKQP